MRLIDPRLRALICGAAIALAGGRSGAVPVGGIYADPEANREVEAPAVPWHSLQEAAAAQFYALNHQRATTDLGSRLAALVGQNLRTVVALLGEPQVVVVDTGEDALDFGMRRMHRVWTMSGCIVHIEVNPVTHVVKSYEWSEEGVGCQRYAAQLDGKAPQL